MTPYLLNIFLFCFCITTLSTLEIPKLDSRIDGDEDKMEDNLDKLDLFQISQADMKDNKNDGMEEEHFATKEEDNKTKEAVNEDEKETLEKEEKSKEGDEEIKVDQEENTEEGKVTKMDEAIVKEEVLPLPTNEAEKLSLLQLFSRGIEEIVRSERGAIAKYHGRINVSNDIHRRKHLHINVAGKGKNKG